MIGRGRAGGSPHLQSRSMSAARTASLAGLDAVRRRPPRRALGGTVAVPAARALSVFGEHALGWIALGAVGWVTGRRRRDWVTGVAGTVAAHGAGVVLKRLVRRP